MITLLTVAEAGIALAGVAVYVAGVAMTRQQVLDLYFMEARARLIDVAAFLDRVDRATGEADYRHAALLQAVEVLAGRGPDRAGEVLRSLSDPTTEPIPEAPGKGAVGAWPGSVGRAG